MIPASMLVSMMGPELRAVVGVLVETIEAANVVGPDPLPRDLRELCEAAGEQHAVSADLLAAVVVTLPGPNGEWNAAQVLRLAGYLSTSIPLFGMGGALVKLCDKQRAGAILGAYVIHTARRIDSDALSALVK